MDLLTPLGVIAQHGILEWLALAAKNKLPVFEEMLQDPKGTLSRIGDLIVWSGSAGTRIVAGLESFSDSQFRIESVIGSIESAQLSMHGSLGTLLSVSCFGVGLSVLSSSYMLWRLEGINKRLNQLKQDIADVKDILDAIAKAPLYSSLVLLRESDPTPHIDDLKEARNQALNATGTFRTLVAQEAANQRRLPFLNVRGRLLLISLMTELRSRLLLDELDSAKERIRDEQPVLKELAQACFDQTMQSAPFRYLAPAYRSFNVTLALMTEVYRLASEAGVEVEQIADASAMFEYFRDGWTVGEGWVWSKDSERKRNMENLRYLVACLEEILRVKALQLMIDYLIEKKISLKEVLSQLERWRTEQSVKEEQGDAPTIFAYAFA